VTLSLLVTLGLEYFLFEMFVTREPNVILATTSVGVATIVQAVVFLFFNWLFGLFGLDRVTLGQFWANQLWLVFFNVLLTYPALKYFLLVEFVYGKSIRNRN